ncbi:MAG: hypothetical protein KA419_18890 [Acidobacteria bacterium]|nr:hypothetical protein [Acidobacteriota bacterium]
MRLLRTALRTWAVVALSCGLVLAGQAITREDLVKMAKAGLDEALIIQMVQDAPSVPTLTTDDLIALKSEGVSQKILQEVMLQAKRLERVSAASVTLPPSPDMTSAPVAGSSQALTPSTGTDPDARLKEFEGKVAAMPVEKALAWLLGNAEDVGYARLLKATDAEKELLSKAFAFAGPADEFAVGESSGRLINFNRTAWVEPCPAFVLVTRMGVVHVLTEAPAKKLAEDVDPRRLNPQDNLIEDTSKTEVQFLLSVTRYDSAFKRDVSYRARVKGCKKDLGAVLLAVGWKKKK